MKTLSIKRIAFVGLVAGAMAACNSKESSAPQNTRLEVRLTDAPNDIVKEVWVDIKDIQINSGDSSSWTSLSNIHPGLYNLMDLTDGRDTLLADATIPSGRLSQIRLILGENNYLITADDQKEMLTTPSGQESGLKVKVDSDLSGGILYRLILDFDAGKSVVKAGASGRYILKPVLRVLSFVPSGGILQGYVAPDSIQTNIYAIMGPDTIASTSSFNGNYQFRDIKSGDYLLSFVPVSDSFNLATANASVQLGQVTTVDTVFLQHK